MIVGNIILGALAVVALAALCLAVLNWILLASISSKANRLEEEIDKKAREFDHIRKEQAAAERKPGSAVTAAPIDIDSTAMQHQALSSGTDSDSKDIEIVCNVRPSYESFEDAHRTDAPAVADSPSAELSPSTPPAPRAPAAPAPLQVALYSPELGGADLQRLYQTLTEALPNNTTARIEVDLRGIHDLHPQQIAYLAQVCRAVAAQGGTMTLSRCEPQLRVRLITDPTLFPLLDG